MTRGLLEREGELEAIDSALGGAIDGAGVLLLIEGPPGIGKTSLLRAAAARAEERGMDCLRARGAELERDFAFGVVRQLFEARLAAMGPDESSRAFAGAAALARPVFGTDPAGPGPGPGDLFPSLHGLHWLSANLALEGPLAIVVDDAHFADAASLRYLHYLAGRVEELPMALFVAARSTAPEAPVELIEALRLEHAVSVLSPAPLSAEGSAEAVSELFSGDPDPAFARALHGASGGNPFLLTEAARSLQEEGVEPGAESADRIDALTPAGVGRMVLTRLGRMPEESRSLARAAAVLGDGAGIEEASELSGLGAAEASEAAELLVRGGVLERAQPIAFLHPLIRTTVYGDLSDAARGQMHSAAADLIERAGGSPARASGHLLMAPPRGDAQRVELLRRAGGEAMARGAPEGAVDFLSRALDEGPEADALPGLLAELGRAEAMARDPAALTHLQRALDLTPEPAARGPLASAVALGFAQFGRFPEAVAALRGELASQPADSPARLDLECDLASTLLFGLDVDFAELDELLDGVAQARRSGSRAERGLLAAAAYRLVQRGVEAGLAADAVEAAFDAGLAHDFPPGVPTFTGAIHTLLCADALDSAEARGRAGLEASRATGNAFGVAQTTNFLAFAAHRRGDLAQAEAIASEALDVAVAHEVALGIPSIVSALIDPMIELGRAEAARELLAGANLEGEVPDLFTVALLVESRGRLHAALGDDRAALADLTDAGARYARWGANGPGVSTWRSDAALAQHRLGDGDAAVALTSEDVELARGFGAARAIGVALTAQGRVTGGEEGVATLRDAVETLEGSGARLDLVRARVELGSALRRAGKRTEARELLAAGLDEASAGGARPLAERAREELTAAGARPRRERLSGVEALTARERGVADLAAQGMSNREIAQALFVSLKTVEKHLGSAYTKLEISGREGLPEALAVGSAGKE